MNTTIRADIKDYWCGVFLDARTTRADFFEIIIQKPIIYKICVLERLRIALIAFRRSSAHDLVRFNLFSEYYQRDIPVQGAQNLSFANARPDLPVIFGLSIVEQWTSFRENFLSVEVGRESVVFYSQFQQYIKFKLDGFQVEFRRCPAGLFFNGDDQQCYERCPRIAQYADVETVTCRNCSALCASGCVSATTCVRLSPVNGAPLAVRTEDRRWHLAAREGALAVYFARPFAPSEANLTCGVTLRGLSWSTADGTNEALLLEVLDVNNRFCRVRARSDLGVLEYLDLTVVASADKLFYLRQHRLETAPAITENGAFRYVFSLPQYAESKSALAFLNGFTQTSTPGEEPVAFNVSLQAQLSADGLTIGVESAFQLSEVVVLVAALRNNYTQYSQLGVTAQSGTPVARDGVAMTLKLEIDYSVPLVLGLVALSSANQNSSARLLAPQLVDGRYALALEELDAAQLLYVVYAQRWIEPGYSYEPLQRVYTRCSRECVAGCSEAGSSSCNPVYGAVRAPPEASV